MANHPEITDVAAHLSEVLRRDIGAHLRAAHGLEDVPKMKTQQAKIHASLHAEPSPTPPAEAKTPARATRTRKTPAATPGKAAPAKPANDAAAEKDAAVINGVAKPAAKAPARSRKAPAAKATAKPAPAAKAPAKAPAAPATAFNKQGLARRLIDMVALSFADESDEAKAKLAYWLHGLPTGGLNGEAVGGPARYWPKGLPRPTTSGWTATPPAPAPAAPARKAPARKAPARKAAA